MPHRDNLLLHIAGACPHLCELDLCGVRGLTSDVSGQQPRAECEGASVLTPRPPRPQAVFSFAMQAYPPAQEGGPIRLQRLNMRFTSCVLRPQS